MRYLDRSELRPLTSRDILRREKKKRKTVKILFYTGLAGFCGLASMTLYHFTNSGYLSRQWQQTYAAFTNITRDMGLVLVDLQVEGREQTSKDDIKRALNIELNSPLITFDPQEAKAKIEELPWVAQALVERRFPDTVFVKITEKVPMALWQHEGLVHLIDHEGHTIIVVDIKKYAHLPLLVGDHAPAASKHLFEFLGAEDKLKPLVTSVVWVGDRRWDIHLKNNLVVKLPEKNPEIAWSQLALIDQEHHVLEQDVASLDFRLSDRIIVKMRNEEEKKIEDIVKSDVTNPKAKINT